MFFVAEREKEIQEWHEQKLPKVLLGCCGGRLPGRNTKEKGREEEESDEGREERKNRSDIAQEVVASIKEVASAQEDAKSIAQRTVGQSVKQDWDCSHIENEEEEEEEGWQYEDQIAAQCMRNKSWRRSWNEEGWKESLCSWKSCSNRHLN